MNEIETRVAEAEAGLARALQLLSCGGRYDDYDWLLLATLVGEADLVIREAKEHIPRLHVPLLGRAIEAFREETDDFRNIDFLRASRAARRRNPDLFKPQS